MKTDTKKIIFVTEVNEDISKTARMADDDEQVLSLKRNKSKALFVNVDMNPQVEMSEEEKIIYLGKRILAQHIEAFKKLAKWLRE